jgi:SAM-dependent methyltransferase
VSAVSIEAFIELHQGLPRQAPGSDAATLEALRRIGPLPPRPRVIDLGCGPGRSTVVLARALDVQVTAVDGHPPFLEQLAASAAASGLADRVVTRCADFSALDDPPESWDLLWSEGAIYHLGFQGGLETWRPLLAPGGAAAVSELTWLGEPDERPDDVVAYWREGYPPMTTVEGNRAAAQRAGYDVVDAFALPAAAWEEYYAPLERRAGEREADAASDAELAAEIAETRREIATWRASRGSYGYVFYLLRKR